MKLQPMFDRILVKEDPPEMKFGNIIIPDTAEGKKKYTGTIVAVGPGYEYVDLSRDKTIVKMQTVIGMRVMYGQFSGFEVEIDGEKYKCMQEKELYGQLIED